MPCRYSRCNSTRQLPCPWKSPCFYARAAIGLAALGAMAWMVHRVPRFDLKDAHVFIAGGSAGIGLETAKSLARRGAYVIIAARRREQLEAAQLEIEKEIPSAKGRVFFLQLDVSDEAAVAEAVAKMERGDVEHVSAAGETSSATLPAGPLDLVICNAGYAYPSRFLDLPASEGPRMMNVNFFGCVNVTRAVLPGMIERRHGRIVFVSSVVSRACLAGYAMCAASKAAVRAFAHSLDMENSCFGVRFQVVNPPNTDTPGLLRGNSTRSPEGFALSKSGAKAISAHQVGEAVARGIESYSFQINIGAAGKLIGYLTAGLEPPTSFYELATEVMFGGWMRFICAGISKMHYKIVESVRLREEEPKAAHI